MVVVVLVVVAGAVVVVSDSVVPVSLAVWDAVVVGAASVVLEVVDVVVSGEVVAGAAVVVGALEGVASLGGLVDSGISAVASCNGSAPPSEPPPQPAAAITMAAARPAISTTPGGNCRAGILPRSVPPIRADLSGGSLPAFGLLAGSRSSTTGPNNCQFSTSAVDS